MARQAAWAATLLALLAAGAPATARAGETDFLPTNVSWNGYSVLAAMAGAQGTSLELVQQLDWSSLPGDAALVVAHPQVALPADQVIAFLRRGGRMLLADDFGASAPLLTRLDIWRVESAPGGVRSFHQDNPNLPVALGGGRTHPLTRGVRRVVTNHPAYLRSRLPSLLEFGHRGQQLLVSKAVGKGELMVLSDPSALINTMMQFRGNRALARNLVQRLAGSGGPLYMVTGSFRFRGTVPPATTAPTSSAAAFLGEFNVFLGELNSWALVEAGLRAAALVLGCLGLMGLLMLLPMPRRDMDGHWARAAGSDPTGLEEDVVRFGRRWRGGGAAYPAAILREEVEEQLGLHLEAPGPLSTVHPRWIVGRVARLHGDEAARRCTRLLTALRKVPHAGLEAERPRLTGISPRELRELCRLSDQLFDAMGVDPPLLKTEPSASARGHHVDEH